MEDHQQTFQLRLAASHHIQSFNNLSKNLPLLLSSISPLQLSTADYDSPPPFSTFRLSFQSLKIGYPYRRDEPSALTQEIYPVECRTAGKTYCAPLMAEISREVDGREDTFAVGLGEIPIMVGSQHCHLDGMDEQQLIAVGEDSNQFGGYFIVNGNEKIVRMLIVQKRNYPIAFLRPSYSNRGPGYTPFAVQMRCVRSDMYSKTFTLHYISDGNVYLRILYKKQEFLIPIIVILKAWGFGDRQIFSRIGKGGEGRSDKVEVVIRTGRNLGLYSKEQFLDYLGKNFRLLLGIPPSYTDRSCGTIFLSQTILAHLNSDIQKFNTMCLMIDKLYSLVDGSISPQNLDALCNQEVLLPGHLYQMILRQKLEDVLSVIKGKMGKDMQSTITAGKVTTIDYLKKILENNMIGKGIEYWLSTGNLKSRSGLDLMQDKGFCVIADRLNNMRFLSHFRSIHRGAYFAEMKTTTVRKLLPESWGFMCPVHTPDGAPCGLLNHITISCFPLAHDPYDQLKHRNLQQLLKEKGMLKIQEWGMIGEGGGVYPVMIQGKMAGWVCNTLLDSLVEELKVLKREGKVIPKQTEIAVLKKGHFKNTLYPMLFISTSTARFLRPIMHTPTSTVQWISPLEQLSTDIALPESPYVQLSPTTFLSILPQHIPFMNYNQSPRNMYQCQMAKQTMGSGVLNWDYRMDNKMYRILQSQKPLVRTKFYEQYKFDDYNSGCNAVVAVLSYTGYDMEDAMIINKSSYQQGFGHGCVYKTVQYSLGAGNNDSKRPMKYKLFKDAPLEMQKLYELPAGVDSDGICKVGSKLKKYSCVLVVFEVAKKSFKVFYNKESEPCSVESIVVTGSETKPNPCDKIMIKLRFDRRPVIGDKFSSRHGQKGVLSMLYPKIDMPFTQSGICPDIIINPNAFPSRMTIGMLIESMAAKSMALQGKDFQYEQFQNYENDNVIDYFGRKLLNKGFNYYGNQIMYSGVYGTELKVDIFMGVVYYQRLRHMVHDKSQARSTGPVDILTQQPLKGRKKGGGIRMGEMQRDALLSHGLSSVVNQRLYRSSDQSSAYVCTRCGLMLGCFKKMEKISGESVQEVFVQKIKCKGCDGNDGALVGIPYVMKYLVNELAAMNIRMRFKLKA